MLTEKDYCNLEISDELRKLGYPKWPYEAMDMDSRLRVIPLYKAQKWLREEKKIYVEPYYAQTINHMPRFRWRVTNGNSSRFLVDTLDSREHYHSYEEALSEGIKEAVKILKENDNKD